MLSFRYKKALYLIVDASSATTGSLQMQSLVAVQLWQDQVGYTVILLMSLSAGEFNAGINYVPASGFQFENKCGPKLELHV